jgi:putative ABC transport system permease protein
LRSHSPEIYLPVNWMSRSVLEDRSARNLHTLAHLRPGIGMQRAQSAADVVAERLRREHPADDGAIRLKVVPERLARPEEDNARSNGIGAAAMLMLVELVLLAAILNAANLLLARVTGRRREFATRLAMGAARGRIIRQLLTEFAVLAALGGLAGFGLALRVWQTLATVRIPGDRLSGSTSTPTAGCWPTVRRRPHSLLLWPAWLAAAGSRAEISTEHCTREERR